MDHEGGRARRAAAGPLSAQCRDEGPLRAGDEPALTALLEPLSGTAHVIRTALTPVFLLSGIAALLNVFANRLGRVADQVDRIRERAGRAKARERRRLSRQLERLRRRTLLLDGAVLLGGSGGALTCVAALLLFVGSLKDESVTWLLFGAFGLSLVVTMGALAAFLAEMLLASVGVRDEVEREQSEEGADVDCEPDDAGA